MVSVLVCLYNSGKRIVPTLEAICGQTYDHLEIILVDDGSTDNTEACVKNFFDTRIRYVRHHVNRGVIFSRNHALSLAQGHYLALCDHDDVWELDKLSRQVAALESHPDTIAASCFWRIEGLANRVVSLPHTGQDYIKWCLFHKNCLLHSSLVIRRQSVERFCLGYKADIPYADDWQLSHDLIRCGNVHVVPEVLLTYRLHGANTSLTSTERMVRSGTRVCHTVFTRLLGPGINKALFKTYVLGVMNQRPLDDAGSVQAVTSLILKIKDAMEESMDDSEQRHLIETDAGFLIWRIYRLCVPVLGPQLLIDYFKSPGFTFWKPSAFEIVKTILKSLIYKFKQTL